MEVSGGIEGGAVPGAGEALALEAEKTRFIKRNLDACGYLRVQFAADAEGRRTLIASFTFVGGRQWHRVEAIIPDRRPREVDDAPRIARAFAALQDGIGAARLARLFAPLAAPGAAAGS